MDPNSWYTPRPGTPTLRLTQLLHSEAQPRAFALNRLAVVIDRIARNSAFEANNRNFRYCDLLASVSNETRIR
jgi:hypothetical protein